MADNTVPLTVIASPGRQYYWAQMAIGKNILSQQPSQRNYWFVVLDRTTLAVVYNQLQSAPNVAPNLGQYNTTDYILLAATLGMGLDAQPQGDLFNFLDLNGGGRQLRRVAQVATQLNCGSLGTFAYTLVGVLGNQNIPGFETSQITDSGLSISTVQLLPVTIGGKTVYTPVQLDDA